VLLARKVSPEQLAHKVILVLPVQQVQPVSVLLSTNYATAKPIYLARACAALRGLVNGSNAVFTVPLGVYAPSSLQVYLNGVLQVPGDAITETTPASGIFTFATAPVTGDQIYVVYQNTTSSSLDPVYSVVAGTNITVNNTDPKNPVISAVSGAGAADATTTAKGIVQLAGDLGGTAAAPTVPGPSKQAIHSRIWHKHQDNQQHQPTW